MTLEPPPRRVVITGMGVVAPNGCDLDTFWNSVRAGRSAAGPVTRFDVRELPNKVACEVRDFNAARYMEAKKARRYERSIHYGIAAARMATMDADVSLAKLDPDRAGIVEGTSVSGTETILAGHEVYLTRGHRSISPFTMINAYGGGGCGEIAIDLGIKGHAISLNTVKGLIERWPRVR